MMLAVDNAQAGIGDTVIICDEGGSARMLMDTPNIMTIRTVIAGIVDEVTLDIND
jgi:microcompartment protein CcmK/EutM